MWPCYKSLFAELRLFPPTGAVLDAVQASIVSAFSEAADPLLQQWQGPPYIRDKRINLVQKQNIWLMWRKIRSGTECEGLEIVCLFTILFVLLSSKEAHPSMVVIIVPKSVKNGWPPFNFYLTWAHLGSIYWSRGGSGEGAKKKGKKSGVSAETVWYFIFLLFILHLPIKHNWPDSSWWRCMNRAILGNITIQEVLVGQICN